MLLKSLTYIIIAFSGGYSNPGRLSVFAADVVGRKSPDGIKSINSGMIILSNSWADGKGSRGVSHRKKVL
jgi:hypothetical protein